MHYVSRLSEDPEPTVRVELMEKVPELSQRCIEKSEQLQLSSSLVEEEILPLVMNFLEDITNTARKGTVYYFILNRPFIDSSRVNYECKINCYKLLKHL